MKLQVDRQADALTPRLDDSAIVESVEVAPRVVLDFNPAGGVVGVEMLRLSTVSPRSLHAIIGSRPLGPAIRGRMGCGPSSECC